MRLPQSRFSDCDCASQIGLHLARFAYLEYHLGQTRQTFSHVRMIFAESLFSDAERAAGQSISLFYSFYRKSACKPAQTLSDLSIIPPENFLPNLQRLPVELFRLVFIAPNVIQSGQRINCSRGLRVRGRLFTDRKRALQVSFRLIIFFQPCV